MAAYYGVNRRAEWHILECYSASAPDFPDTASRASYSLSSVSFSRDRPVHLFAHGIECKTVESYSEYLIPSQYPATYFTRYRRSTTKKLCQPVNAWRQRGSARIALSTSCLNALAFRASPGPYVFPCFGPSSIDEEADHVGGFSEPNEYLCCSDTRCGARSPRRHSPRDPYWAKSPSRQSPAS